MADAPTSSNEILIKILGVLGRIDEKLHAQEESFKCLEKLAGSNNGKESISDSNGSNTCIEEPINRSFFGGRLEHKNSGLSNGTDLPKAKAIEESGDETALTAKHNTTTGKVPYTQWDRMDQEVFFMGRLMEVDQYLEVTGLLEGIREYLGDWWTIPDDRRVRLTFSKHAYHIAHHHIERTFIEAPRIYYAMDRMKGARQFDDSLRSRSGNDFLAIDFDEQNNCRLYRLGKKAIGNPLMIERKEDQSAPWSRLIVYQGMTSGESINPEKHSPRVAKRPWLTLPIPYFRSGDASPGMWDHIYAHLRNKSRKVTTNPYMNIGVGFHTTFYEIMRDKDHHNELWKHGLLYGDPVGRSFRKCAYTIYTPSLEQDYTVSNQDAGYSSRHWTILLLAPGHFFDAANSSFPMSDLTTGSKQSQGMCLGRLTKIGAELNLIRHGLERISDRWADFQTYFENILDSGDSLMEPSLHDSLLFDDGSFSRSRKYFWAIDCLSEFELSITDNIVQWQLYKDARVEPLLMLHTFSALDLAQLKGVERQYNILKNQREYFREKLASTKALRDALFSASTVIESRASTRLGENVKLLTFVSIFFLPLSFCTSLWSVNNTFSINALTFTIIIIGITTYIVVLNLNNLVHSTSRMYHARKGHLVNAMKSDGHERWRIRGQRFEVFRPKYEKTQPSEWYVPFYAALHPWVLLGVMSSGKTGTVKSEETKSSSVAGYFAKPSWHLFRRRKIQEPEERDEAWVI